MNAIPNDSPKAPRWDHILSKLNIWSLYVLLFAFPLSGFFMSILGGYDVNYFNLFTIPALMKDPLYGDTFLAIHIWISYILYAFVGLHIAGSLYHHFFLKDNVLLRMLPQR